MSQACLQRAEAFQVPRHGKVVIGGKGCFSLRFT